MEDVKILEGMASRIESAGDDGLGFMSDYLKFKGK